MQLGHYLHLLSEGEAALARGLRTVAHAHAAEPEVEHVALLAAGWCDRHAEALAPFVEAYAATAPDPPDRLHADLFQGPREGGIGLLRDLHDVYLQASNVDIAWTLVGQAAKANRDRDLDDAVNACDHETGRILQWLRTQLKTAAPQALVVA